MASLSKDAGRDGFRLAFYGCDKRKRSIWLGGYSKRMAETVKDHVEHLLAAKGAGVAVDLHSAKWLASIGSELRLKLVQADLIEPSAADNGPARLGEFLADYIKHRADVKPATVATYRQGETSLIEFFGADRRLDSITAGDAERWRIWQTTEGNQRDKVRDDLADNTVRRRTGLVRQFFAYAIRRKLIGENPFVGLAAAVHGNAKRQRFVTRGEITKALEATTCPQLRAVIALSRYAGLRIPSEIMKLRWNDIDLEAGQMTIRADKTEHHADGGLRVCPIFPELRPFLERLSDDANPGIDCPLSDPVFTRWKSAAQNLRTAFLKVLARAGLQPWPKLFHNCRASRQTELLGEFPAADVCSWLGNTQAVAMKHYAMPTADSFRRAVCGSTGGSISAKPELSADISDFRKPQQNRELATAANSLIGEPMGDAGLEPATSTV